MSKMPFFASGIVRTEGSWNTYSRGNGINVFLLRVEVVGDSVYQPQPGQFFMLRRKNSKHILGRPISVYLTTHAIKGLVFQFMIQKKGDGTSELLSLKEGDQVELLGPLGNGFPLPEKDENVCLVGGGIGSAPMVNLASAIEDGTYDFYACFKDHPFGTDRLSSRAREYCIATESGYAGKKGMLNVILDAEVIREKGFKKVYACGPTPMLKYVQQVCEEAGVECYLSLENFMACGVGACLGCTIKTKNGNKRCCKDGPVFKGSEVIFDDKKPTVLVGRGGKIDLSVEVAGVKFRNPVIAASGTFGYGGEYGDLADVNRLGGIISKGLTLEPRDGNPGRRVLEVPGGMMNSIGLENPGIPHFCANELPKMMKFNAVQIANLSGSDLNSYVQGAELLDKTNVPMIELNISCPNVCAGGMAFGVDPDMAAEVVSHVKKATMKPLIVKLTPNAPDVVEVAMAVKDAGANGISLVNTFLGCAIDIETGRPVFGNKFAGVSGPGIKPIALRIIYQVATAMQKLPEDEQIPIIGLGGISNWRDAVEFIMAGCSAVQVGTATFNNPRTMSSIIDGLQRYMKEKGFSKIEDFRGIAL